MPGEQIPLRCISDIIILPARQNPQAVTFDVYRDSSVDFFVFLIYKIYEEYYLIFFLVKKKKKELTRDRYGRYNEKQYAPKYYTDKRDNMIQHVVKQTLFHLFL